MQADRTSMADWLIFAATWAVLVVRHSRPLLRMARTKRGWISPVLPVSDVDRFAWRKMFDHNPAFTLCCDKLAAKAHALDVCPELRTAKVLWEGTSFDTLPLLLLEGEVVVKANHGSAWNVLVRAGNVDLDDLRRRAESWLTSQYGPTAGEWGYRDARRRLIVEEMLLEDGRPVATEYKFHVSAGRVGYVYIKRRIEGGIDQWVRVERDGTPVPEPARAADGWTDLPLPATFPAMRDIAERLAAPFDHMRVDLYSIGGVIYFSELTAYPQSGRSVVNPRLAYLRCVDWDLRRSWFLSTPQRGWLGLYAAALRRWLDRQPPLVEVPRAPTSRGSEGMAGTT